MRVHVCANAELKFKVIFEYSGSSRLAWVMRVKHGEKNQARRRIGPREETAARGKLRNGTCEL